MIGLPFEEPLRHRPRCLGCGVRGQVVGGENEASELANDHAFPGWRDLPVVPRVPRADTPKAQNRQVQAWRITVEPLLPPGWLDAGGPIRTERAADRHGRRCGMRHVPNGAPGGGYDMATAEPTTDLAVFARRRAETGAVDVGDNFVLDLGM